MALAQFAEQVELEARQMTPRRTILTVLAAIAFAVGWVIGVVFRFVWAAISWSVTAVKVGYRQGRGVKDRI